MGHIKQNFSIKDLELLTGIKAHTIRIWEKRYNILNPERTETNIRTYDGVHLQKILNISFLNEHGYKISRIAKLSDEEIAGMVTSVAGTMSSENRALNSLKMAMLNFDQPLFHQTYDKLRKTKTFREIFKEVFLPLLNEIGLLWQTDTIKPVHEHYIVDLIKQKIYLNIALLNQEDRPARDDVFYVLFLPHNEIHDLGILYLNYELRYHNYNTIYLGPSLPLDNMRYLLDSHENLIFMSYTTVAPPDARRFIEEFQDELCQDKPRKLLLFGQKASEFKNHPLPNNVKVYDLFTDFLKTLKPLPLR